MSAGLVLVRGFQLQVVEGSVWEARARDQHQEQLELPAPRGAIRDRNGVALVVSQELYRVAVAPGELRDPDVAARRLQEALGLSAREAARAVDPARRWVVLPGRYDAPSKQALDRVQGLYFESVLERSYPHGDLAQEILGRVTSDGRALGGIEQVFDTLLSGVPGVAVARRDARGRPVPGSSVTVVEPRAGHDLYLSLDLSLQEIADGVLGEAVTQTGSSGGDLILVDPRTGDLLAAASHRRRGERQWRGATEPYEAGSTLKPFLVSALLAEGRATLGDSIFAEEGRWDRDGRVFTDTEEHGWLTLRDALRVSSNIAMAKASDQLEPTAQYAVLRDFGFGTPTGVMYSSEAAGSLQRPDRWSSYSQASLAIGYEMAVTPLQMVMAYGALANGGVLMEPRLVREVRSRDGKAVVEEAPRAIRRVVPESVAKDVGASLLDVVEAGTGQAAGLGVFRVAGKTGTARRVRDGRYETGSYTASFAGFFPADEPQLAFVVKLDQPQGSYYGGVAAAPVTRATLAATLAARSSTLDRSVVSAAIKEARQMEAIERRQEARAESAAAHATAAADTTLGAGTLPPFTGPYVFRMDGSVPERRSQGDVVLRRVPEVEGLALRDAVRRLHSEGFRVELEGRGTALRTWPAEGHEAVVGSVVRLRGREAL